MGRWLLGMIVLVGVGMLAACARQGEGEEGFPSIWEGAVTIEEVLNDPKGFEGQEVTLIGYYRGWDLFAEAGSGPPVTRSDVAIADATGAIYIVSQEGTKWKGGVGAPNKVQETETLVRVRGTVRISSLSGAPYLEVREGEVLEEGLPLDVVLRVRRTGGFAGFDHELMALRQGVLYALDRGGRWGQHVPVDPDEVAEVVQGLADLAGHGEVGELVPDTFVYTCTIWDGRAFRMVTLYDTATEAADLLERINEWFALGLKR